MDCQTQVLEAKGASYSTPDGRRLQSNLNFSVAPGQLLLIRGGNGCGKSTLIKAILGEWPLDGGTLNLHMTRDRLQFIPQLENTEIHFPLVLRDVLLMNMAHLDWERVDELGLVDQTQLKSAWNTASGGERKRTLLTRAMLADPSLLVLDEPMNHLDKDSRRVMIGAMARFLRATDRRGIVMVCHQGLEPEEAADFDLVELDLGQRFWGNA